MMEKKILLIIFVFILAIIGFGFIWKYRSSQEITKNVILRGYIDSVGRRAYQQIITAYVDKNSYPSFYYYVGSENKPLDFEDSKTIALVTEDEENKFISETVYDQDVTIIGTRRMGKICYSLGKIWKGDQEQIEKCHKMSIVIVEDILDQKNSSLILTK